MDIVFFALVGVRTPPRSPALRPLPRNRQHRDVHPRLRQERRQPLRRGRTELRQELARQGLRGHGDLRSRPRPHEALGGLPRQGEGLPSIDHVDVRRALHVVLRRPQHLLKVLREADAGHVPEAQAAEVEDLYVASKPPSPLARLPDPEVHVLEDRAAPLLQALALGLERRGGGAGRPHVPQGDGAPAEARGRAGVHHQEPADVAVVGEADLPAGPELAPQRRAEPRQAEPGAPGLHLPRLLHCHSQVQAAAQQQPQRALRREADGLLAACYGPGHERADLVLLRLRRE
mmetsp:Transcript_30192/g.86491  ORF Transcript_30192/g.86491 Transcript_30192/m.86491 type:complete len:289 (-) Transcript_30192:631-1497(-)